MSNSVKTMLLMTLLMGLLLFIGNLLGGRNGLVIAFIFSLIMNFVAYWFSSKIVLLSYGAQEVTENEAPVLFRILRRLTAQAQLPMPRVYIIPSESPNAFATGRNPSNSAVAVTRGILRILSEDELEGVLAHELAHIRNRDILIATVVATIAGAITFLANMARFAYFFGGGRDREDSNPLVDILLIILAPIAALLIQLAISRSQEFRADEIGAHISQKPLGLANALRKLEKGTERIPMQNAGTATAHLFIVNPLSAEGIAKLFQTHPPIEDRVARLERMAMGGI